MNFSFFDSPELLDIQRQGFYHFLKKGIPDLLGKQFPIKVKSGNYSIELWLNQENVKLIKPDSSPRDCILKMKTYSCKLYAQIKIVCKKSCDVSPHKVSLLSGLPFALSKPYALPLQIEDLYKHQQALLCVARRANLRFCAPYKYVQRNLRANRRFARKALPLCSLSNLRFEGALNRRFVMCGLLSGRARVTEHSIENLFETKTSYSQSRAFDSWKKTFSDFVNSLNLAGTTVYQSQPEWVLLGQLPMMTKRGHFVINGSPRVIVHQVVRSPGIYFQKVLKKDDRNIARFYGDIIPLKGVWVRLQMTKKGRIEAKFKKGKKVQVEFLQKCLQVIEDGESRALQNSLFKRFTESDYLLKESQVQSLNNHRLVNRFFNPLSKKNLCSKKKTFVFHATRKSENQAFADNAKQEVISTKQFLQAGVYKASLFPFLQIEDLYASNRSFEGNSHVDEIKTVFARAKVNKSCENYLQTLSETRKSRANSKAEHEAFIYTYDKLYRTTQDKELEEWQKKKTNSSFFNHLSPENAFKRKKCSENLFASFKMPSRYDLGLLGREKINDKFGQLPSQKPFILPSLCSALPYGQNKAPQIKDLLVQRAKDGALKLSQSDENSCNTQLTSMDLHRATVWLYELRKGEKSTDDIDHSQNRRVRTSGSLLQTQFENGVERLKNVITTKLQEWTLFSSRSRFSSIFKSSYKIRYSHNSLFKKKSQSGLGYTKMFSKAFPLNPSKFSDVQIEQVSLDRKNFDLQKVQPKFVSTFNKLHLVREAQRNATQRKMICQEICKNVLSQTEGLTKSKANQNKIKVKQKRGCAKRSFAKLYKSSESALSNISYKISVKELFSTKPITGALREFFGSNPLSQYMDQTNPLAEITHKRRMSSLGIGGVSRDSAGMAIRGIHPTHYGRICPIETPEGKNAGLVNSLAFYTKAEINGFLKTPYYRVVKGQIQYSLGFSFASAKEESLTGLSIAPSDLQKSSNNVLRTKDHLLESVPVRVPENQLDVFKKENPYKVELIGISPIQMISVATSLIPFLEHNDANRALMGSNMQRQAVPLMISERPIVGTGLESVVIMESGHLTESQVPGFASHVTANKVVVDSLSFRNKKPAYPSCFLSFFSPKQKIIDHLSKASLCSSIPSNFFWAQSDQFSQSSHYPLLPLAKRDSSSFKTLSSKNGSIYTKSSSEPKECQPFKAKLQSKSRYFANKDFYKSLLSTCTPLQIEDVALSPHKASLCPMQISDLQGARVKPSKASTLKLSKLHFKGFQICKSQSCTIAHLRQNKAQSTFLFQNSKSLGAISKYVSSISPRLKSCKRTKSFLQSSIYCLTTFSRSNQNTCITEKPLIKSFDWVQRGDILSDCSASNNGELSVGKNVLVAYIPWEGYNFEDAIVISERLVREHVYTSLHIERYSFQAQDLNDGNEWFTKHLPGIEDRLVEHLEASGLPKIGSFLREGDILVGKIRYLNKKPSSPYERLLCDILGEKNFAARNKSLYVPKGVSARVIYHRVLNRFENALDNLLRPAEAARTVNVFLGEKRVIQVGDKISGRHGNKGVISTILPRQDMPYLPDGTPIDIILNPLGVPSRMNVGQVLECLLGLAAEYLNQHFKITAFDERYGVEASKSLVFLKLYQARLQSNQNWLFQVSFPGKTRLIDGRSGECFDQWITVGKAYILKLIHMVSEKIHARSTGPYALITQQPLRGRSNKGGQRLGEMEVWALEGFGAAYTLQELLTKKSDDFFGRKQIVDSILPNPASIVDQLKPNLRIDQNSPILGHPEIFKVLLCELQALCLDLGVYVVTPESFQRSFLGVVN